MRRGRIERGTSEDRTEPRRKYRVRRGFQRFLAAAGVLAAVLATMLVGPLTGSAQAETPTPGISITLTSMSPRSPDAPIDLAQHVTFTATVVNTSNTSYRDFAIGLERGRPLNNQSALDNAIANPPATDNLLDSNDADQQRPLPSHSSVPVSYVSDPNSNKMCLCATAVYPYALVVRAQTDEFSGFSEVARTQVLVSSFLAKPKPVQVGWIWPLIDRPHRSLGDTVFTDDALAASVAPGGRLFRSLKVVTETAAKIRMTLVVDPELLDSLAIMADPAGYSVRQDGKTVKGTGASAALAWLTTFRVVAAKEDVVLTGYADPDVNAITRAGITYSTALDPQVKSRIKPFVPQLSTDISWPAGGTVTGKALDSTIASGASAVVLTDAALSGQNNAPARPDAISPLPTASGTASALVTDSGIEKTIDSILKPGATAVSQAQQTLLAQLAIRAAAEPDQTHYVVLTPNRWVDPTPAVAVGTILATISNPWSVAMPLRQALATIKPIDRGPLQTGAESASAELSPDLTARLVQVAQKVASLRDALNSNASAQLLGGFNLGLKRGQSSAWRTDRAAGVAFGQDLSNNISGLLNSVSLVKPSDGTYGLSSSRAPVVVTVVNRLDQNVTVRVAVSAVAGVIGFDAAPQTDTIPANGRKQIQLPTHVERLGQFKVTATLTTPDGQQLGEPVQLTLRATALGGITRTITIVAGTVLVLALIRRFVLRYRNRRRAAQAAGTAG
ncbi:MAG: hypothetical protein QOE71_2583 [Pseudonocardiales bacterium]|nr:hypothetical protein [Pseudonocardiales bacterium]